MAQPDFYTMCATVFARDGSFDEDAMRLYLKRQIDARLGVYLGSGGNGETHAMLPDELFRLYAVAVEECRGKVPVHANLPEEHTADQTIAQARIAVEAGVEALHLYTLEGRHGEPDGAYQHFLLRVDPELRPLRRGGFGKWQHPTARNAVASTFGLTGAEYGPQVET